MFLTRITPSARNLCLLSRYSHEALLPVIYDKSTGQSNPNRPLKDAAFKIELKRGLHTTKVRSDLETGLKGLGAGIAALGTTGPGLGMGLVFQALVAGTARNPSSAKDNLTNAFIGAALCEVLGLLSIVLGVLNLFL